MFDLPDAKRVRRSDLSQSSRSSSPSSDIDDILRARFNQQLQQIPTPPEPQLSPSHNLLLQPNQTPTPEPEPEAFTFNLFHAQSSHKISLAAPERKAYTRPLHIYLRGALSPSDRENFRSAALEGADILRLKTRFAPFWRAAERKPRFIGIGINSGEISHPIQKDEEEEKRKGRVRKGKKTRIRLRKKAARICEREVEEKAKLAEKEIHLREKKTKENRRKQLKKREKERERKAKEGGEGGGGDG